MTDHPLAAPGTRTIADARRWFAQVGHHYLDTAAIGLPPAAATDAMLADIEAWRTGQASAPGYDRWVAGSRRAFATLVGTTPGTVAVGSQVSALVGTVAASLPAGAEVVCPEGDFTSVLFPFLAQAGRIRVRTVPLEGLADAVGPATTMVAYSIVQSADGRIADVAAIGEAAAEHGAVTLADGTQACGWLPVRAADHDLLVVGAYKWLLSPRGTAFLHVRPDRLSGITPALAGWYAGEDPWDSIYGPPLRLASDARRLDVSPAWLNWVGTEPALEAVLAVGVDAIHAHDVTLADGLRQELGLVPAGSAIVSVAVDAAAVERLAAAGVRASQRAGRLRLAFHLYNDQRDVDVVVRAVRGR